VKKIIVEYKKAAQFLKAAAMSPFPPKWLPVNQSVLYSIPSNMYCKSVK